MNVLESEMLDLLKRGRDEHGVVAVKAEFEAEGTRPDELLRLLELAFRADLKVALKIGGCEAITDLLSSKLYGINYIIAPMVESRYALSKFIEAKEKVYGGERHDASFLFNLETDLTLSNLEDIVPLAQSGVDGIVFGRVDFTLSRGLPRTSVNDPQVTEAVLRVAAACAAADLELVVGGAVSTEAIPALREMRAIRLDRFETRKVIFAGEAAEQPTIGAGIENAVQFELAWLKNKRNYYDRIASEDTKRIAMMEERAAKTPQRLTAAA